MISGNKCFFLFATLRENSEVSKNHIYTPVHIWYNGPYSEILIHVLRGQAHMFNSL
jgi:hypothetical protein